MVRPDRDVRVLAVLERADAISILSCFAGLIVISLNASSSVRPPYFTDLAASLFSRRACSALSELIDTRTPLRIMIAALYGIASYASILYPHQSENARRRRRARRSPSRPCSLRARAGTSRS